MTKGVDVAIVGGGIIGLATAYYLSSQGVNLAIIDKKYLGSGSTGRCIGGIRQQFSTPSAIKLMKENLELFSQMEDEFGFEIPDEEAETIRTVADAVSYIGTHQS